jgi:hypothetical protein
MRFRHEEGPARRQHHHLRRLRAHVVRFVKAACPHSGDHTFLQKGQPSNSYRVMGFSGRGNEASLSDVSTSFLPARHITRWLPTLTSTA